MTDRASLAGNTAAGYVTLDVETTQSVGQLHGLTDNELQGIEMARSIAHHSDPRMTERYIYSSPEAMSKLYKGMELFHGKDGTSIADVLADAQDEE